MASGAGTGLWFGLWLDAVDSLRDRRVTLGDDVSGGIGWLAILLVGGVVAAGTEGSGTDGEVSWDGTASVAATELFLASGAEFAAGMYSTGPGRVPCGMSMAGARFSTGLESLDWAVPFDGLGFTARAVCELGCETTAERAAAVRKVGIGDAAKGVAFAESEVAEAGCSTTD